MKYRIGDFRVITTQKTENLQGKIAVPTAIEGGRVGGYEFKNKTREFTVFQQLNLLEKKDGKYYRVINDIFDFIDLIELLKAFVSNKLELSKEYQISDSFTAKIAQIDGNIRFKIHFKNYTYSLFLTKFECNSLSAKFSKILQRCEAWQEQEA